jgi:hypothetical protein
MSIGAEEEEWRRVERWLRQADGNERLSHSVKALPLSLSLVVDFRIDSDT